MSGPTVKDLARATDPVLRRFAGMVRRMAVETTVKIIWRLAGVRGLDGKTEAVDVEVFPGIGFYARPGGGAAGKPEAIVVNVGDARAPVIVATRDEKAARAIRHQLGAGKPAAGETIVFASVGGAVAYFRSNGTIEVRAGDGGNVELRAGTARVYVQDDGTVEVRSASGTAKRLATLDDLEAHAAWAKLHTHTAPGGGGPTTPPDTDPPDPDGTDVLKGE